ncbi:rhodanese-like domain-containing protein [Cellulomonas dongxiuzhuiae]|uniref:Rhodanese-like domain-containing protein n=1 Tax=Cellulomonas dongxiuzhuiae TaxID=2819979 RepID=A0ABX8GHJ0_9CELL|nr:rhodanese-like domain-containing protein [Cellulomonas dongxiuzhuiae]MBO3088230.1 rhodanese-like domain-containing protein [Cellulomonas dongxiuzhuiae]MBO3094423.1 rhodanese-like domain-containing protein [Cellulomonas dongxiuzhuiae]QWC15450.1 rhodanese-like domain-containing protein [Cellulomonas dongxiuzhuiae]
MSFRDRLRRIPTVDAHEAMRLVEAGALVVDVRGGREWARQHVPGAVHLPLRDLEARALELPDDRLIVTFCTAGLLSRGAARLLTERGFDVVDLAGGLMAWRAAGGPLVR